jgi:PAS domain S-box-containing protein
MKLFNFGGGKDRSDGSDLARSLHDEKLRFELIVNNIDDGVILIDDQNVIRLFNPAAASMTGWQIEEAMSLDYTGVIKFVDSKNTPYSQQQNPIAKGFLTTQTFVDTTANIMSRNNKVIAVDVSVSPIVSKESVVTGVIVIIRNVDDKRRQDQARADFISTASHEMRTPVAAIEGYLALALNDKITKIDAKAREYLEKAQSSTKHLGQLFQDLLTSAKAEDGRLSNHPQVVEFGNFLEQLVEDLRFGADKKHLAVDFLIGAQGAAHTVDASSVAGQRVVQPLYYVYADPDRVREVITNLFDNAVKYTDSGKITIGLTGDEKIVQFYIKDTGPGIPKDDIPHLFQKFYRVDNSATRTIGGTGLGLFICKKIIELYSGRIWADSLQGQGSTFYINLPRLDSVKAMALQTENAAPTIPV